jgi:transcriptional regulator with XRE-family HTH domain
MQGSAVASASNGSRPLNGRYPAARDATVSPTETFGDVLKYWRGRAGLSLHQLEEAVGMSATNLSRIERGLVGPPTAEWLDKLAGALGAPRSRLYRAAGRIPPSDEDDRTDVIEAILTDPDFTQEEKSFLVNAVKFVRQHRGIRRRGSR